MQTIENKSRNGPLFIALASLCWSFGGLFIRFIPWSAMSIVGIRAFLAAIVFIIYRRNVKLEFTRGNVFTALCLSATTILYVYANQLTTAAAAILLQFTAPIFIILIYLVFYGKKPSLSAIVAVFMTLVGMMLFFVENLEYGALLGNIFALLSGLSMAGVYVCNKRPDTNPENALFLGFLINSIIGLPFAITGVTADIGPWVAVFFLGVVQVGFAYIFFSKGIKKTSALLACLTSTVEPILNPIWVMLAGLWGFLPVTEIPGIFALIGGIVIILTVVGYNMYIERTSKNASGAD
ncbi:MAG: DMT family transporter [Oscillospiraceae bacterium]|nr:DMT family transporter [Oscillospiraceae bacterium]